MDPRSLARNELSSRNGRNTPRLVALVSDSRAYANGVVNSDSTARITPLWHTTANTCLNVPSPPMAALKTEKAMPAVTRPITRKTTSWPIGAR